MHSKRLLGALAALAYLPLLWSSPGKVSADTKTYLYLDPSKLLARAPYLWDEHIGFGTVTHQNIGYLFPMGPYYWLMDHLGVPDWIAQRLWLGTLLLAAGAGIVYLCRTLGWTGRGVGVAAVAYMLSPYIFDYAARLSAILLPWAGLGWLLSFTILSVREGGWRWPARFAFTVATVGGVNATSLVLVGLAPAWWIIHALASREVRPLVATRAVVRIGLLTVPVSLWWMAGLLLQGRYGIPILRYTETYEAVSRASTVPEVLRGLGYWFFYGSDKVAPWVTAGRPYTQTLWLLLSSFGIVALGLLAAATVRWRERGFAIGLLVIGVVVSAGAHPYDQPTLFGGGIKRFIESGPGMALRSTPRAVPLIALALALFLGSGARALAERYARLGKLAPRAAVALFLANVPTFLLGHIYTPSLLRSEAVPTYWTEAARSLSAGGTNTRVLETPGSDFADYRWGGTIDPITPGLTDRPYVARELIPYGSAASADLLNAYERRQQDGLFEPEAVAPLARLMAVGDVVLRSDLQFERYRSSRPRQVWDDYTRAGLTAPVPFGPTDPNVPLARLPLLDEAELTASPTLPDPPAVATFGVPDASPIVRTASTDAVIVDGDGEGLYDAAAAGLLDTSQAVLYAGDLAAHPDQRDAALATGARLVVTDQNRRQARSWGSVRENLGVTEQVGETAMRRDANDNRLDLFPSATDDHATVVQQRGVARIQTTGYGNPISYTPEDRAANAFDGDPLTAWRVGAFADVTNEQLEVQLTAPTTADHLSLQQPTWGAQNRWLTQVELRFDGKDPLIVDLDDSSRQPPGQTVTFPSRSFTRLTITLLATNFTKLPGYRGLVAVGFAEVAIPGVKVDEVIRPPVDLLARSNGHPLDMVFTRQRANQIEPNRSDPELSLSRTFTLPSERTFTLTGEARLSGVAADEVEQKVTGAAGATAVATASIVGAPLVRAASAIDGDPTTAWTTPIDKLQQTITVTNPSPVTTDHLDLSVVNDGRHSLPTMISLTVDGGEAHSLPLPPWPAAASAASTVTVPLPSPVTGTRFGILLIEAQVVSSIDYLSELPVALPLGIAEIGFTGLQPLHVPDQFSNDCRADLVTVDGSPLAVRLTGSTSDGVQRRPLLLAACAPVTLGTGEHLIRSVIGRDAGIDVDRLLLRSSPQPDVPTEAAPTVTVDGHGPVSYDLTIAATAKPFWLILSQSHNPGWRPTVQGASAGPLTIVNGYANGWLITPGPGAQPIHLSLDWTPQRIVWLALLSSALAFVVVLFVGWKPSRRGSVVVGCRDRTANDNKATFGHRSSRSSLVWPIVGALAFAAFGGLPVGASTLVIGVMAARLPRSRRLLVWLPPALIGFVAVYAYAKTAHYHLPTDLEWPGAFGPTHQLGWLAVALTTVLALTAGLNDEDQSHQIAEGEI